jgi:8-oxo-dGTP pyrophosphatase MutT (NUDIX family)
MDAVAIRDASTVVLLRDNASTGRPDVWMLTRTAGMTFAPGMSVFPGGRVDDADAALPWSGRPAAVFAAEFGCDETLAQALVGAAVRETFEETGVLLTQPGASLAAAQPAVEAGRVGFGDLLREHSLSIDADALRPWARWVTPASEKNPRRYDTRFFVAALPAGAEAADLTSESTVGGWTSSADAFAAYESGERDLMPPTLSVLDAIGQYASVAEVVAAAAGRSLEPVSPVIEEDADGLFWAVMADGSRVRRSIRDLPR